ncbi:MAG: hypothetical protein D6807_08295 [Alphaproteobacteria bacterium]|nr:MAG: hypothetical protein D6807_08295 [Alphaproteobacteria bacterium]
MAHPGIVRMSHVRRIPSSCRLRRRLPWQRRAGHSAPPELHMTPSDLPLADVSATATLLLALALNLALCSASRVSALFAWPATGAARLIRTLEARYNRPHATEKMRRADSVSVAIVLLLAGLGFGVGLSLFLRGIPYGWIVAAAFIAMLLNLRPQLERMRILANAVRDGSPEEARATLGLITGRDACEEGASGICKAAIESTAMALAQGVVGPLLWYLVGDLPGLFAFRIIDTASVMIDERSENARSFGWAPRCLDAILLYPAVAIAALFARLAAVLVPGARLRASPVLALRGARYAWPVFSAVIAAFADGLAVRLGGPVCVGAFHREGDSFGPSRDAGLADLARARSLFLAATLLIAAGLTLSTFLFGPAQPLFSAQ